MRFARLLAASCSDWPGEVAAVLFTVGCNARCVYCANYDLFHEAPTDFGEEEAYKKLRELPIDHIVICGGEPTIQANLVPFCQNLHELGWHIKLDTNGTLPDVIASVLPYIDYIAVDIKTTLDHYVELTTLELPWSKLRDVLDNAGVLVEYRTTLVDLPVITPKIVGDIYTMLPEGARYTLHTVIIKNCYGGPCYAWSPEKLKEISWMTSPSSSGTDAASAPCSKSISTTVI